VRKDKTPFETPLIIGTKGEKMDKSTADPVKKLVIKIGLFAVIWVLAVIVTFWMANSASAMNQTEIHTANFTANVTLTAGNLTVDWTDELTVNATITDNVTIDTEGLDNAIDDAIAVAVTLVLVLFLQVQAVWGKHQSSGDYYLAGFAMIFYGMFYITTISWLSTLFILVGIYDFAKGRLRGK